MIRDAVERLQPKLPELADDLQLLVSLHAQSGASARESTLAKARTIVDKVLKTLCERHDVSWGKQNPTIENMIGPLVAAKVIPGLIAAHVRTVQSYGNLAAHGEPVTAEHVELGCKALVAFLAWHAGDAEPAESKATATAVGTARPGRHLFVLAGAVLLAGIGVAVAIVASRDNGVERPEPRASAPAAVDAGATAPDALTVEAPAVPAARAVEPALVVDLTVLKADRKGELALAPQAKVRAGDRIAFRVTTSRPAHVYLLQKVGGELDVLFPTHANTRENPLAAKEPLRIPEASWFTLVDDDVYGPVEVSVIASRTPIADLDAVLASTEVQEGAVRSRTMKQVQKTLERLAPPGASGVTSRGRLELLDETQRTTISVRYTQRPGDDVVVAGFVVQQVK